jgi:predicted membrane protein
MFSIVFTLVFVFIIVAVIINFYRLLKRPAPKPSEESPTIVKEKEVIKEIVKIRCPYCGNLYDEKYDKCPTAEAEDDPHRQSCTLDQGFHLLT